MPVRIGRRAILAACASPLVGHGMMAPASASAQEAGAWQVFKQRFLNPEGRIIDDNNGGISHSEGQAWGMLLAVIHDDRAGFERIFHWTRTHLAIRGDRLLAWRFRSVGGVDDINSATDADLFYAWALLRADQRWPNLGYRGLAAAIARDLLRISSRQINGRTLLMPGPWGFEHRDHLVLNPSYYVFPALEAMGAAFPHPAWQSLVHEGERMLAEARYGRWGLPADWVVLHRRGGAVEPQPVRGDRFGYDAVRLPMYLAWSGRWQAPLIEAASRFWSAPEHPFQPAWVTLSNNKISPYPGGAGTTAIRRLIMPPAEWAPTISAAANDGYYSSCLALLSAAAAVEAPPRLPLAHVASIARDCRAGN